MEKMQWRLKIRCLVKCILSFLPLIISFFFENVNEANEEKITELNKSIEESYKVTFDGLKDYYYSYVILVFSPKDKIVKHLGLNTNNEDEPIYYGKSIPNLVAQVSLCELEDFAKDFIAKAYFVFTNHKQLNHFNALKRLNKKVSFDDKILQNHVNSKKALVYTKNYSIAYDLANKYTNNAKILNKLHVKLEKQKYFDIYSYTPYSEDTLYIINLYPRKEIYQNKIALNYYLAISQIWTQALPKLLKVPDKIHWVDLLVKNVLDYFFRSGILKKRMDVKNYPDIVSFLFPIQFVDEKRIYFAYYEIVRFCVSLKNIREFVYFSDFFNKMKVEELQECVQEIYFSEILTKELFAPTEVEK